MRKREKKAAAGWRVNREGRPPAGVDNIESGVGRLAGWLLSERNADWIRARATRRDATLIQRVSFIMGRARFFLSLRGNREALITIPSARREMYCVEGGGAPYRCPFLSIFLFKAD